MKNQTKGKLYKFQLRVNMENNLCVIRNAFELKMVKQRALGL